MGVDSEGDKFKGCIKYLKLLIFCFDRIRTFGLYIIYPLHKVTVVNSIVNNIY